LVGPRHASLALDYVFDTQQVEEYLSRLTAILGGNWLRLAHEVWKRR
jgi:hypothetical protein